MKSICPSTYGFLQHTVRLKYSLVFKNMPISLLWSKSRFNMISIILHARRAVLKAKCHSILIIEFLLNLSILSIE